MRSPAATVSLFDARGCGRERKVHPHLATFGEALQHMRTRTGVRSSRFGVKINADLGTTLSKVLTEELDIQEALDGVAERDDRDPRRSRLLHLAVEAAFQWGAFSARSGPFHQIETHEESCGELHRCSRAGVRTERDPSSSATGQPADAIPVSCSPPRSSWRSRCLYPIAYMPILRSALGSGIRARQFRRSRVGRARKLHQRCLTIRTFLKVFSVTLRFAVIVVSVEMVLGVGLALLLDRNIRGMSRSAHAVHPADDDRA